MQDSLFPEPASAAATPEPPRKRARAGAGVEAAAPQPALQALRAALPVNLRLGTSSWSYPGWIGSVWAREYGESKLSKQGLRAYAQHPLLRTVSLDRAFYQPLEAVQYANYAVQVPEDFRFVVKAPGLVADALRRDENGRGQAVNPLFLDPVLAVESFAQPALDGLRQRLGALVFQLSPVPDTLLRDRPNLLRRLGAMLRECGATYCLGLHAKMPPIEEQLPILRALWPGPLVCRWNLHRKHGAYGYEEARRLYGDFDKLVDPDPETRAALVRVIKATTAAGFPAYVTLGNKAEGSAPLSVAALAEALVTPPAT